MACLFGHFNSFWEKVLASFPCIWNSRLWVMYSPSFSNCLTFFSGEAPFTGKVGQSPAKILNLLLKAKALSHNKTPRLRAEGIPENKCDSRDPFRNKMPSTYCCLAAQDFQTHYSGLCPGEVTFGEANTANCLDVHYLFARQRRRTSQGVTAKALPL